MDKSKMLDIPGYAGRYSITPDGQVWSHINQKWLRSDVNNNGYHRVKLYGNQGYRKVGVHRLVMLAFVGPSDLQVNHKNGDKSDNRLENLEYCTSSENQLHAHRTGLNTQIGEKNSRSKLTYKQVVEIKELLKDGNLLHREIGELFGVTRTVISRISRGDAWGHVNG